MSREKEEHDVMERTLEWLGLNRSFSRRQFLKVSGITIAGFSCLGALSAAKGKEPPLILMDKAEGLVIGDPTRCVACKRCELACTEFNDGKAQPSMARIKVSRNIPYGPKGLVLGERGHGSFGGGLIVQDLCKQCPHPVPCANACPNDAIVLHPRTKARVVDVGKCIGCRMCQRACPWEMMSFDAEANKATKCFLCDGRPKCVEACPAGALKYVAWVDLSDKVPPRVVPAALIPPEKAAVCNTCHKK